MGKPIAQSIAEIEKAAGHIDYYINKSKEFLATEDLILQTGDNGSVILQPLGPTLGNKIFLELFSYCSLQLPFLDAIQIRTWGHYDRKLNHHEALDYSPLMCPCS